MPTENRSSNTELLSQAASAIEDLLANGTGTIAAGAWASLPEELRALSAKPTPQPHPEPIAWMVGTAFWWTKEEAERDAAATGLPVIPFGALTGAVKQHQGEPVAFCWSYKMGGEQRFCPRDPRTEKWGVDMSEYITDVEPLYTHADPGEVERFVAANTEYARRHLELNGEVERLRAELGQCEAMATMVAEREWAEHVGTGPVSSKVEAAFTQLHNDLHEAGEKLAERDALLHEVSISPDWSLSVDLQVRISDALSASAEPQVNS
jgi:hypothetical protein